MTSITSVESSSKANDRTSRPSGADGAELAKLERELTSCINCDSSKTTAGQTKIAELKTHIEALKEVNIDKQLSKIPSPATKELALQEGAEKQLRFDGVGNWLNEQA